MHHLRACQDLYEQDRADLEQFQNFYPFIITQLSSLFPLYFQEIYDAEMQDFQGDQYDDSPAGFRLIYKYGRSEASVWKLIQDADQWIAVLVDQRAFQSPDHELRELLVVRQNVARESLVV